MINTLKETWASLQDLKYGEKIVAKTVRQCIWYWSQYFVILTLITWVLIIAALTYFTPQLAKILNDKLPDVDIAIKNGQLESRAQQPYVIKDKDNFVFILDTNGKPEDIGDYKSGLIVLKDKMVIRDNPNETKTYEFKDIKDFYIDKEMIISWIKKNTTKLWGGATIIVTVLGLIWAISSWSWQLTVAVFWAEGVWLIGKLNKRNIKLADSYKLILHAMVLPTFIGWASLLSPNQFTPWLTLGLLLFYALAWMWNMRYIQPNDKQ